MDKTVLYSHGQSESEQHLGSGTLKQVQLVSENSKMEQELCKYHQRGCCKFGSECQKYHENEICKDQSCTSKACRRRHPRLRKYFCENMGCKFGKDCSYAHRENVNKGEIKELTEELKNIKAEINFIKKTL